MRFNTTNIVNSTTNIASKFGLRFNTINIVSQLKMRFNTTNIASQLRNEV